MQIKPPNHQDLSVVRSLKNYSVLVVDDDEDLRDLFADLLMEHSARVRKSVSGEEALEMMKEGSFDLVVSDMLMSGMNGLEFIRRARELKGRHPIFILMSGDRRLRLHDLYDQGISALVRKPLDFNEIPRIAENLLLGRNPPLRPGGERVPTHIPVQIRFSDLPKRMVGRVLNISANGMLIETEGFRPDVGWKVEFKMKCDERRPIEGTALVRWLQSQSELPRSYRDGSDVMDFGIEFQSLNEQSREEIQNLMQKIRNNLESTL